MDLTARQAEVAALVAKGWGDKKIARELGISPHTVHAHIKGAAARLAGPGSPLHRLRLWGLGFHAALEEAHPVTNLVKRPKCDTPLLVWVARRAF